MKIEVNIEKRYAIGVIMGLLILAGAIFAVAQWSQPDAWHDASAVRVNVDSTEYSLQEAIDSGLLGIGNVQNGGQIDFKDLGATGWQNPTNSVVLVQWSINHWNSGNFNIDYMVSGGNWTLISTGIWGGGEHYHSHGSALLNPGDSIRMVDAGNGNPISNQAIGFWQTLG